MDHSSTQASYDRLSRWYDLFSGSEKRVSRTGLQLLEPKPGQHVLEIGCGTGHALAWLAETGAHVAGLDLSAGMLAQARQTVVSRRRASSEWPGALQVGLCQGDAIVLPFPARTFDSIFMSFTLELFPGSEIPLVLAECRRVLRWNGILGVVALAKEKASMVQVYEWFHRNWPRVVDCRPIYVHAALIKAGFEIQEARRMVMWGLPVEAVVVSVA